MGIKRTIFILIALSAVTIIVLFAASAYIEKVYLQKYSSRGKVIQFRVDNLLNARVVTTITNGKLKTWNTGIDSAWSGLATRSAADKMGSSTRVALPNDAHFEANEYHPNVILHFANTNVDSNQVRFTGKNTDDRFWFATAPNYYSCISLFFMSAFGSSSVEIIITYEDGLSQSKTFTIEDWAVKIAETKSKFFLSANLAKWGNTNNELEPDNHYLMGINVEPDRLKKVTRVTIHKPASESTLTFWGAAGCGEPSAEWCALAADAPFSYEGRVELSPNGSVYQGYPGIITRIKFKGTTLSTDVETKSNELFADVKIDNGPYQMLKIPQGTNRVLLCSQLSDTIHTLTIYKRVETCVGVLCIRSFLVRGQFLNPDSLPPRKMLFMGDSFTAGQAAEVEDTAGMPRLKAQRENARLSYARILADRLNAQCHIVAFAGRGIMRDWQGLSVAMCAPAYYQFVLPEFDSARWNAQSYIPDVYGICLGSNDFDSGIPDKTSYIPKYVAFIKQLLNDAPQARVILITSPTLSDTPENGPKRTLQFEYLKEVARHFDPNQVFTVQIAKYPVIEGDWHPGAAAHRAVADELEPFFLKAFQYKNR